MDRLINLRGSVAQNRGSLGATVPNELIGPEQAFAVEFCTTFILVFTVFASCDGRRSDLNGSAPLTIGLSVTVCLLFAVREGSKFMRFKRLLLPRLEIKRKAIMIYI